MRTKRIYINIIFSLALTLALHYPCFAKDSSISDSYPEILHSKYKIISQKQYKDLINKGNRHLEKKEYTAAIDSFTQAKEILPQNPDAYINLAVIYIHLGSFEDASLILHKTKTLDWQNQTKKHILYYNLGICSYRQGDYRKSIRYYFKALQVNPSFKEAWKGIEKSCQISGLTLGDVSDMYEEDYDFSQKKEPKVNITTKSTRKPIGIIKKNKKESFDQSNKLLRQGSKTFEKGDINKAIELINRSITLNPKNAQSYYRLGIIYISQEQFLEANKYFRKAIKYDPHFTKAYINLGSSYGKLKEYKKALSTLLKASRIDRRNPKVYYNLSMVYIATGKTAKAIQYLKKAKSLCDSDDTLLIQKIDKIYEKIRG